MALFSIFGKKPQQSDDISAESTAAEAVVDDAVLREDESMKMRRETARKTAEKIDAIESEIARDILKSPSAKKAPTPQGLPNDSADEDYPSSNLFHTTLIRVDRETMIMFKEDMDE